MMQVLYILKHGRISAQWPIFKVLEMYWNIYSNFLLDFEAIDIFLYLHFLLFILNRLAPFESFSHLSNDLKLYSAFSCSWTFWLWTHAEAFVWNLLSRICKALSAFDIDGKGFRNFF
jgi:hypothetical protein